MIDGTCSGYPSQTVPDCSGAGSRNDNATRSRSFGRQVNRLRRYGRRRLPAAPGEVVCRSRCSRIKAATVRYQCPRVATLPAPGHDISLTRWLLLILHRHRRHPMISTRSTLRSQGNPGVARSSIYRAAPSVPCVARAGQFLPAPSAPRQQHRRWAGRCQ